MGNAADFFRHSGDRVDSLSPPWVLSLIFLSSFSCLLFATGFSFIRDEARTIPGVHSAPTQEALNFKTERPKFRRALALARPSSNQPSQKTSVIRPGHDQPTENVLELDFAEADGTPGEPTIFQQISALGAGGLRPRSQRQSSTLPPMPEKVIRPKNTLGAGAKKLTDQAPADSQSKPQQVISRSDGITLQAAIRLPQWRRNAADSIGPANDAMVAIVIDDLGLNRKGTKRILDMKGPYTLSFISYAERLGPMLRTAKRNGHELMLHLPMEPFDAGENAGPNALMTGHSPWEIRLLMEWGLSRVQGIVGVNNHMGSRFTSRSDGMSVVMDYLRDSGLFYLDSRTASSKVSEETAQAAGVPFLGRDIFLDHEKPAKSEILANLRNLEAIARRHGYAVAIAHPYPETLDALYEWREKIGSGVRLVPITAILRQRLRRAEAKAPTSLTSDIGG